LETARFLAPAGELLILGIGVTELIMALIDRFRLAIFRLSRRKHVVVCGLDNKGLQLVRDLRRAGERVLVIEKNRDNPFAAACEALGALVLVGDATKFETLRQAGLERAEYLIAVCRQDGTNVEIAVRADKVLSHNSRQSSRRLPCYLHIVDLELRTLFRQHRTLMRLERVEVEIFNVFENGARLLFREHFLDYEEGKAITREDDPRQVHLVVVGFGNVGKSVVLQALRMAHFPNESQKQLRLTVIDKDAEPRRRFEVQYPSFEELCQADFVTSLAEDPSLLTKMEEWCKDPNSIVTFAVCFDDDSHSLSFALTLLNRLRRYTAPVLVRIESETGLAHLAAQFEKPGELKPRLGVFSRIEQACSLEAVVHQSLNKFAQEIHQDFVDQQRKRGRKADDPGIQPWKLLDPDLKDSNWRQAEHIPMKLRAINCYTRPLDETPVPADPKVQSAEDLREQEVLLAKMEHNRWVAERKLAGWKYGPKRNVEERTSPYLVPWEQLTPEVQQYDIDAVRLIPELLRLGGQAIYRKSDAAPANRPVNQDNPA
jgi:voltage-gated potassium channel Kch